MFDSSFFSLMTFLLLSLAILLTGLMLTYTKKNAEKDVHVELLAWYKPPRGVFKLNLDGPRSCTGLIGAGGVIRD